MRVDGCVFGTSSSGSGSMQEGRRVYYPKLCSPSVPSKQKRVAVVAVGYQFSRKATQSVSLANCCSFGTNETGGGSVERERERRREKKDTEEKLSQRGIPCSAKCYRSSTGYRPTCSNRHSTGFKLVTLLTQLDFTISSPCDLFNNTTSSLFPCDWRSLQHFTFNPNQNDFLCEI